MRIINCSQKLVDLKGEPLKDRDGVVFTIGAVLSTVMSGRVANANLGWQLGRKFAKNKTVELKAEEIVFIKNELDKNSQDLTAGFPAVINGQVIEILEASK